jgi:MHS family alpha-ketoglutarate permease-like MFS transporter
MLGDGVFPSRLLGTMLAIVVFWIRRGLIEPQSSKHAQEQAKQDGAKSEAIELFSKHPQAAFTVIMLTTEGRLPLTPSPPIYKNTW